MFMQEFAGTRNFRACLAGDCVLWGGQDAAPFFWRFVNFPKLDFAGPLAAVVELYDFDRGIRIFGLFLR
jgi:hypothetical protein